MHEITIQAKGKKAKAYQVPDSWEQLTPAQLLQLIPLVFCLEQSTFARVNALKILLPLNAWTWQRIQAEQVYDMLDVVKWLWTKPLAQTPISSFDHEGITYHLPDGRFKNVSGIEFAMTDFYFRRFCRPKPDLLALDKLIATLCRPLAAGLNENDPFWNGDKRERYNAAIVDRRALAFASLPVGIKVLVMQYTAANIAEIQRQYHKIFEPAGKSAGPASSVPPWLACMFDLAEKQVFGSWEMTCHTPIHTLLLYLTNKKANAEQ